MVVGEDLVYSLFATPLIVFGALSGLWPLASGLWPKEADIRDLLVLLAQAHPFPSFTIKVILRHHFDLQGRAGEIKTGG